MNYPEIIGNTATVLTVACFVPQVVKIWKTKETKDISLAMYIIFVVAIILWVTYGFLIHSTPVLINNIAVLILAITILIFKIKYG